MSLKITCTVGEEFQVLCVDKSTALHDNVVIDYCGEHAIGAGDLVDELFTVDADEADLKVVKAALEHVKANPNYDSEEYTATLEAIIAEAAAVEAMKDAILSTGASEFVAGGEDPAIVAKEWVEAGFTASTAKAWWKAGGFDAGQCEILRVAGLTPEQCSKDRGGEGLSWAHDFCNLDVSLPAVLAALD